MKKEYKENYVDERLSNLFNQITTNNGTMEQDEAVEYDLEIIKSIDLIDYDCLRLFKFWLNNFGKDAKNEVTKIISKQQLKEIEEKCKIFRVSEEVKHLLKLTKPSKLHKGYKMPFDNLFLDTDLKIEDGGKDIRIFGIYLNSIKQEDLEGINEEIDGIILEKERAEYMKSHFKYQEGITVSVLFYAEDKPFVFSDFCLDIGKGKLAKKIKTETNITADKYQKIIEKNISGWVLNLLHFLNEPRIQIFIQEHNNKRREKKGLISIPSELRTKIDVDLQNYIEKVYFNGLSHSKLGFSFWVRGHWRRFLSPRFVNKQGQKTWILPHISGEGLMPPQVFEVTTKNA